MIGDRDVTAARLGDDEIDAILRESANKYLAAATAGEIIFGLGYGAVSKSVDDLSISYGDSPTSAYRTHLSTLREKGAKLTHKKPAVFRRLRSE